MSYNTILKNDNFDIHSSMKKSYYDDVICPTSSELNNSFKEFKDLNYVIKPYILSPNPNHLKKPCAEQCSLNTNCKGYSLDKFTNNCTLFGSYPRMNELKSDTNMNYYLKTKNMVIDKIKKKNRIRIKKNCIGKSIQTIYENNYGKPLPGIEECIKYKFKEEKKKGSKDFFYVDLDKKCIWKNLGDSPKNMNVKTSFLNTKNLGKTIKSNKLDKYSSSYKNFMDAKGDYGFIETTYLDKFDENKFFPEYYKTVDENYAKLEDLKKLENLSGVSNNLSGVVLSNSVSGMNDNNNNENDEDEDENENEDDVFEDFVTKSGPKREQLARVKDYGCNNIYFILLLIPVLLIGLGFYYYKNQSKLGKNKNL